MGGEFISRPENALLRILWQQDWSEPRSPWQRGSNENTNGLLRQYFTRGTDFDTVDPTRLDKVENSLNRRPRATLR